MASPSSGDTIEHYELVREIGKGGMGEVFLARDTVLDRNVALKFVSEGRHGDPQATQRLLREARSAAALDHPFTCKVYGTGELEGRAFIAMEYVPGETLADRLEEDPVPAEQALDLAIEIAGALQEAHEKEIIHRDLKPGNIMVTPQGHAKVMDFGLAKKVPLELEDAETAAALTQAGATLGTIPYMSPEQARGEFLDPRSDIFSFGVLVHEMLTGEHPFHHDTGSEVLSAILRDPPPPLEAELGPARDALQRILRKAMAKDPADRYQETGELLRDLQRVRNEISSRPALRRAYRIATAAVSALVVVAAAAWWLGDSGTESGTATAPAPMSVLIADFDNASGDPAFEGAIEQSLGISLEGAPYLSMFRRSEARSLAGELDPESAGLLDARLAQLVSRNQGIELVIEGTIEGRDDGYEVMARALDVAELEVLASASSGFATKADFNQAIHEVAGELISELGAAPAGTGEALARETFTTSSLEAMSAYARAQELAAQGAYQEAITAYEEAIEADPEFGRAYSGLATIYVNRGEWERGQQYYEEAMAHLDRMSERGKHRTRGVYYLMNLDTENAIEEYSALLEKYPADDSAAVNLALAHFLARNLEAAVEWGRRSVELVPGSVDPRYNLTWYALAAGRFELAAEQADMLLERNPDHDQVHVPLAMTRLMLERPVEEVRRTYERLGELGDWGSHRAVGGLADLAVYQGRLQEAEALLERGIEDDLAGDRQGLAANKLIILAETLLAQGRPEAALDAAARATATGGGLGVTVAAARVRIAAGRIDDALETASELGERLQPEPRAYAELLEGEVALQRGDAPAALERFGEGQEHLDTWLGHLALGRAYLQAEAFLEAHDEFELCWERRGEAASVFFDDNPTLRYLPPVHYYLGRALEGMGSREGAAEAYRAFLDIKEGADGGPLIEDAQARLRPLTSVASAAATGR